MREGSSLHLRYKSTFFFFFFFHASLFIFFISMCYFAVVCSIPLISFFCIKFWLIAQMGTDAEHLTCCKVFFNIYTWCFNSLDLLELVGTFPTNMGPCTCQTMHSVTCDQCWLLQKLDSFMHTRCVCAQFYWLIPYIFIYIITLCRTPPRSFYALTWQSVITLETRLCTQRNHCYCDASL